MMWHHSAKPLILLYYNTEAGIVYCSDINALFDFFRDIDISLTASHLVCFMQGGDQVR